MDHMRFILLLVLIVFCMKVICQQEVCHPPYKYDSKAEGRQCIITEDIFPNRPLFEIMCKMMYYGELSTLNGKRVCKQYTVPKRSNLKCSPGWISAFEGAQQWCYLKLEETKKGPFKVGLHANPCTENGGMLAHIPTEDLNKFFFVSVMKGRRRDKCNVIDKFTQWYLIGYANVNRTIASPKYISAKRSSWVTPYEDLNSEFAERLSDYYYGQEISAKPVAWDSGTPIFADNYGKRGKLKTFIYMSDCGLWRDSDSLMPSEGPHGYLCVRHAAAKSD